MLENRRLRRAADKLLDEMVEDKQPCNAMLLAVAYLLSVAGSRQINLRVSVGPSESLKEEAVGWMEAPDSHSWTYVLCRLSRSPEDINADLR